LENIIKNKKVIDLIVCRELKYGLPIEADPEKQVFLDAKTPPFKNKSFKLSLDHHHKLLNSVN
jgi:hypothetical protein